MHFRYDIVYRLYNLRPDVVVSGEMGPRSLQAALYCHLTKTPFIIASEGTAHTERGISKLKIWTRRCLARGVTRFWSNGRETTALLQSYGADPTKIDAGMTGITRPESTNKNRDRAKRTRPAPDYTSEKMSCTCP